MTSVSEEEGKTGKIVIFRVKEKQLVRSIKYKGNKSITNSEILEKLREKKVGLSQESPYDPTRVKKAERVIKSMLAEKGRQNATIEATTEHIPPNAIELTFNIDEGPKIKIEKIDIEGNTVFSDRKVKRAMKLIKEVEPDNRVHQQRYLLRPEACRRHYAHPHALCREWLCSCECSRSGSRNEDKNDISYAAFHKAAISIRHSDSILEEDVDRFFITIKVEENDQYRVGDVRR